MNFLIYIVGAALAVVAFFALKFIQEDSKQLAKKQQKDQENIASIERQLAQAQETLKAEISSKQATEDLLYKTKDDLDTLSNRFEETEKKLKLANNELQKKEESLKKTSGLMPFFCRICLFFRYFSSFLLFMGSSLVFLIGTCFNQKRHNLLVLKTTERFYLTQTVYFMATFGRV